MGDTRRETHHLRPSSLGDDNPEDRSVEQVLTFIQGFDATRIDSASIAYSDAKKAVGDAMTAIEREARELARVWEGDASVEAQRALGILYTTLDELGRKLQDMVNPLSNFANVVRQHQAFLKDDWGGFMLPNWHYQGALHGGLLGSATYNDDWTDYYSTYNGVSNGGGTSGRWGSQNELAGQHLQTFGNDLKQIFGTMPDTLDVAFRDIRPPGMPDGRPDPVDYSFGDGPGVGDVAPAAYGDPNLSGGPLGGPGTTGPSFGSMDPPTGPTDGDLTGPTGPGSDSPTDQYPGTDSQGNPPTTTMSGPTQNPGGPTSTGPNSSNPTTHLQDYQPPNPGSLPTTGHGTNPSSTSYTPATYGGPGSSSGGNVMAAGVTSPSSARGGSGMGMPFMPMGGMGGAGAQESRDRESTTWLHEDDDVWGGDADSAVNSRIG
ncbi:WXG100 family type VII secretion target [Nonomuraea sp. B12E4]|uniref:WXG100 family type VII secretion target n=1 Tax=Nonomuraea sp. B12E4 TaxID=3153564 RepID=UPI00325F153C